MKQDSVYIGDTIQQSDVKKAVEPAFSLPPSVLVYCRFLNQQNLISETSYTVLGIYSPGVYLCCKNNSSKVLSFYLITTKDSDVKFIEEIPKRERVVMFNLKETLLGFVELTMQSKIFQLLDLQEKNLQWTLYTDTDKKLILVPFAAVNPNFVLSTQIDKNIFKAAIPAKLLPSLEKDSLTVFVEADNTPCVITTENETIVFPITLSVSISHAKRQSMKTILESFQTPNDV